MKLGEYVRFPSGKKIKLEMKMGHATIPLPKGVNGTVLGRIELNEKVRERCFYVDWHEEANQWNKWRMNLKANREDLEKAIESLKKELPKHQILKL